MALTTTPLGTTDFPDIIAKETDTDEVGTANIFDGAISLHSMVLDNSQNSGHNTFFKFYNAASATAANSLPNLVIRVEQAVSTTVIIADGLSFTTGVTIRAVKDEDDTNNVPPDSLAATLLVGS
mgnify:FL=1|jgi:hypothetical protein